MAWLPLEIRLVCFLAPGLACCVTPDKVSAFSVPQVLHRPLLCTAELNQQFLFGCLISIKVGGVYWGRARHYKSYYHLL